MRRAPNPLVEPYRAKHAGRLSSDASDGNNGVFLIPYAARVVLQIIASDGMGWDHLSVVPVDLHRRSLYRTPTWEEMAHVKHLFFADNEWAVEYHPARSHYRNQHEYCLHLWRPQSGVLPVPDPEMVAPARAV